MIDALVMIATPLCFAKVVRFEQILKCHYQHPFIKSSPFPFILADFCHFALQEIRHSLRDPLSSCWLRRRSQSSEETKPEKRLQCRENRSKTERICVTMSWSIYTTLLHVHAFVPGNKLFQDSTTCGFSRLK